VNAKVRIYFRETGVLRKKFSHRISKRGRKRNKTKKKKRKGELKTFLTESS
jgi:hypothetical protein